MCCTCCGKNIDTEEIVQIEPICEDCYRKSGEYQVIRNAFLEMSEMYEPSDKEIENNWAKIKCSIANDSVPKC